MRTGIVRTVLACALLAGLLGVLGGSSAQALIACKNSTPGYCIVVGEGTGGAGLGVYDPNAAAEVYLNMGKQTGAVALVGTPAGALVYCSFEDGHYHLLFYLQTGADDRPLPLVC